MNQIERLHKIDQLLTAGRAVSRETIQRETGASHATFKRDMEFMKDRLNAPLLWDRVQGGYRFDKKPNAGPIYELPGLWFNESELHALIMMQHLLQKVEPGLLEPHLQPLQSKIQAVLSSLNDEPEEITKRVRIFSHGRRKMVLKNFEMIATATVRRKRLRITHFNRGTGIRAERMVSPQQLIYYRDNWYLDCWCHLREAIRSFSIDAIESAELMPKDAKNIPLKKLRETLADGYGIFSGESVQWAKLRIGPIRARWAAQSTWHPDQKESFEKDGHYLLEIPYADDRELLNDILALLPDVEVIAPVTLRHRLHSILQESIAKTK